jgi:hypothetical protein
MAKLAQFKVIPIFRVKMKVWQDFGVFTENQLPAE